MKSHLMSHILVIMELKKMERTNNWNLPLEYPKRIDNYKDLKCHMVQIPSVM